MRVYVASSAQDFERVRAVQAVVRAAGHEVTFDWTDIENPESLAEVREDWTGNPDRARVLARRERRAVISADVLVLCGPTPPHGLGCFIETGMALARGVIVIVIEPIRESVFWYLPGVIRCQADDLEDALEGIEFDDAA